MATGRASSAVIAVATCTTETGFMTSLKKGNVPKGICSSPKIALCLVECPVTYCRYFLVLLTRVSMRCGPQQQVQQIEEFPTQKWSNNAHIVAILQGTQRILVWRGATCMTTQHSPSGDCSIGKPVQ